MVMDSGKDAKTTLVVNHFVPKNNHHPLLGFYVYQSRKKYFTILFGVAALSSLLLSALTWTIVSSTPVKVTVAIPSTSNEVPTHTSTPTISGSSSGKAALTEDEFKSEVRKVGGSIYWTGPLSGANYTLNHLAPGQDFVRYLPNGQGLEDSSLNYRVIATYKVANAYDSIVGAFNPKIAVGMIRPNGTVVYYVKAKPLNVFMAFKGLDYQIEIFDPTPGASLKLATTPGAIVPVP